MSARFFCILITAVACRQTGDDDALALAAGEHEVIGMVLVLITPFDSDIKIDALGLRRRRC